MIERLHIREGEPWERARFPLLEWAERVRGLLAGPLTREVPIDTAALPVTIKVSRRPREIALVRAVARGSSRVLSGGSIEWEPLKGEVRIHDVSALAAATKYDCVLAITE